MFTSAPASPSVRHDYAFKPWIKGLYSLLGLLLLGMGVFSAFLASDTDGRSMLFGSLFFIPMGGYLLLLAFRSRLTIEGPRLTARYAFRQRSAELPEMAGLRTIQTRNGSFWRIQLKTGHNITLMKSFQQDDEFRAFVGQIPDLDLRDRDALIAQVQQDAELGATPEDRLAALKRARIWGYAAIGLTAAAAAGVFLAGPPFRAASLTVLTLIPLAVVYLILRSPLLFTLFRPKADPRGDFSIAFIAAAGALAASSDNAHFLNLGSLMAAIMLIAVAITAVLGAALRRNPRFWSIVFALVFFSGLYAYALVATANTALDHGAPSSFQVQVAGKHTQSGRSTSYYIDLPPWGPVTDTSNLSVNESTYHAINTGDTVCLVLHPGALHAQWYEQVGCPAQ